MLPQMNPSALSAPVLGQLLLMQSVLCHLPSEKTIFDFVCRGLMDIPGVSHVSYTQIAQSTSEKSHYRYPLLAGPVQWGELSIQVSNPEAFLPYEAYLQNFCSMVAVILGERHQRQLNERHQIQLEQRVQERTQQLTEQISERMRIEEELRRNRNMLAHILDSVPQSIFWKDLQSVYLGCNQVFARAIGLSHPEQIMGKTDFNLPWPRSEAEAYRADDRAVMEGKQPKRNIIEPLQQANGKRLTINTTKVPLTDESGEVYGVLGVYDDITERLRLEEQFRQAQKLEAIGQLAGGIAHDFNNMLTVIEGNASILLEGNSLTSEGLDLVRQIVLASERASGLTRQLLLFSRKQKIQLTVLDLNAVVANMTKMLQRLLGETIRLRTDYASNLPWVCGDAGTLEQVLLNLTLNARDAMPKGGQVTITTSVENNYSDNSIRESDAVLGRSVCLRVEDEGCGIAPEHIPHLFEPFFTTKEVGRGTGLGLATVYGIVKQHNGWIEVDSTLNRGTVFRVYLPVKEQIRDEMKCSPPSQEFAKGSEVILVVEDEPTLRLLVNRILRRCGYTVLLATSGVTAQEVWKTQKDRIQILFTDIVMPDGISGRELADQLTREKPGLKVLYTSGYSAEVTGPGPELIEGVNFLQKPYNPVQLTHILRACLDPK